MKKKIFFFNIKDKKRFECHEEVYPDLNKENHNIYQQSLDTEAVEILSPVIRRSHIWALKKSNHQIDGHGLVRKGKLYMISVWKPNRNDGNLNVSTKIKYNINSFMNIAVFVNEISILKNCNHPNILKYLGVVFLKPMKIYFITEFCHGLDLYSFIHRSNLWKTSSMCDLVHIGTDMAKAMEHLRQKNIIHRDFKSSSVLLFENIGQLNSDKSSFRPKWMAKISDFKMAVSSSCGYSQLNKDKEFWTTEVGSFEWTAPEAQSKLKKPITYNFSTDLYSLGTVLVELISGDHPFFNLSSNQVV